MRRYFVALVTVTAIHGTYAYGAGYELKEYSADAMAAAYAGSAATSTDASYLAYNPASLASVENWDLSVSAVGIFPGSDAHYSAATTSLGNPTGGSLTPKSFIGDAPVPEFAIRKRLSDRWAAGLVVTVPWGLSTDYPKNWAGRYYALKTQLLTLNAAPTVSYQVSPDLWLAGGLQIEYAKGFLTSAIDLGTLGYLYSVPGSHPGQQDGVAKFSADGWSTGFNIGAIAKVSESLTLGVSYRSELEHTLKGPLSFVLDSQGIGAAIRQRTGLFTNTQARTDLSMPDLVSFGARDEISDHWTGLFEVDWTDWNKFRELRVVPANPVQPDDVTAANWRNTLFVSAGAEYRSDERWSFRAGVAYDQSPVPNFTRGPRIPDADRIWVSTGVTYHASGTTDVKFTVGRLFNLQTNVTRNQAQLGNSLRGTLVGTTDSNVNVIGLQWVYRG